MADTAVDTTTPTTEIVEKDLKEKKAVVEEVKEAEKENGTADTPANGVDDAGDKPAENGEKEEKSEAAEEKKEEEVVDAEKKEEVHSEQNGKEEEKKEVVEAVKRPAEEEIVETKKQKIESDDTKEAEVEA